MELKVSLSAASMHKREDAKTYWTVYSFEDEV